MKKRRCIPLIAAAVLLAILLVPVPAGVMKDGGTRVYAALTYKIVHWNRLLDNGIYEKTVVYGPFDCHRSVDALWKREAENLDKRRITVTVEWVEKSDRTRDKGRIDHIRITEIYKNCFYAVPVNPEPYQIRLNGTLSSQWCEGDQVLVTYENLYCDVKTNHIEADLLTIEPSDFVPNPNAALSYYKPVIYLYPEKETEVSVALTLNGKLTCTYPDYREGWTVTASPDGSLTDKSGQTYNYLYWEGETLTRYDLSEGFCIKGKDTAAFLETALAGLGLNRREANEFIVFWLPMMQKNAYNIISFAAEEYTESAKLAVTPAPDTIIRVFMVWQAAAEYVEIAPQELSAPQRSGFTVIEWGGAEIKSMKGQ